MDPYHVETPFVFDISSDEECCGLLEGEPSFDDNDDSDWLAKLLGETNAGSLGGDSDEVVLVKEVNPKSKSKGSQQLMDDDDCVILDSDPDKSVAACDAPADDYSSDDLLIVGESGQVACRDYPHSRHLCYKFPFSTAPHEGHCSLCHCYVCDLPAPCTFWGTGMLNTDHCHATDREEHWRIRRKQSRGEKISLAYSMNPQDSFNLAVPQNPQDSSNLAVPQNPQDSSNLAVPQNPQDSSNLAVPQNPQDSSNLAVPQLPRVPLPMGPTHLVANCIPYNSVRTLNPCTPSTNSRISTEDISARGSPLLNLDPQHMNQLDGITVQRLRPHRNGSQLMPHCVSSRTFKRVGLNSFERTSQRAWDLFHNNCSPAYVEKSLPRSQCVLPYVRPTIYINPTSFPYQQMNSSSNIGLSPPLNLDGIYKPTPRYSAAEAICGWSNDLAHSFQHTLPSQAQAGNDAQFQTCEAVFVNQPNFQSSAKHSLTAAEIESLLLED
ncbi:hypothetical protein SAY87_029583 [Trapa incisa]|uniref:Uncharacterized protein n=1 Tax=Trapa incisa TaxID=236973 RepID=A0AAN7KBA3_9MYRT|nr:hypothetical protein SAY87_029583 [Trapa incisa]